MKLSIIIVNYNVKYFLEQCLLSISESIYDFDLEVYVVDNHSSDDSLEYLSPKFPWVKFISNTDNRGFSRANNQAINLSIGEYVLLLNPDTVVGENVLSNVCRFMDMYPQAGGVGVKMIDGAGNFLSESKRGFPSPWTSFCKIVGLSKLLPYSSTFGNYYLKYLDENKVHSVDVLAGAFMFIRREALNKSGLLDEDFFMYGEDIDMSYRIIKAGYQNYYLPEIILHYKGESTGIQDIKYVRVFYGAMYIFFKKHYPNYSKIYSYFITLGIYLRAALAAFNRYIKKLFKIQSTKLLAKSITMDHSKYSYEEILKCMNSESKKNVQYYIYSPKSDMLIGTHYAKKGKENVT